MNLTDILMIPDLLTVDAASKSRQMMETDPTGIVLSITAISVVFVALAMLYIIYKLIGKAGNRKFPVKVKKEDKEMNKEMTPETALAIALSLDMEMSGETYAAIAMALHRHLEGTVHDEESFVLTIRPTFSTWASRHSTLRQLPQKQTNK